MNKADMVMARLTGEPNGPTDRSGHGRARGVTKDILPARPPRRDREGRGPERLWLAVFSTRNCIIYLASPCVPLGSKLGLRPRPLGFKVSRLFIDISFVREDSNGQRGKCSARSAQREGNL